MAIVAYGLPFSKIRSLFESDNAHRYKGPFCPFDDGSSGTSKEDLYRTEDGGWIKNVVVLNSKNGAADGASTYTPVSSDEARKWLERYEYTEALALHF